MMPTLRSRNILGSAIILSVIILTSPPLEASPWSFLRDQMVDAGQLVADVLRVVSTVPSSRRLSASSATTSPEPLALQFPFRKTKPTASPSPTPKPIVKSSPAINLAVLKPFIEKTVAEILSSQPRETSLASSISIAALKSQLESLQQFVNRTVPPPVSWGSNSAPTQVGSSHDDLQGQKLTVDNIQVDGNSLITTSGNFTLAPAGSLLTVTGATNITGYASASQAFGMGLADCDTASTSKLLWDATTGKFSCGSDQSGGSSGEVQGTASSSFLFVANAAQFAGTTATTSYSRFGTATTGYSNFISAANDLLVSGDFETDASAQFDGNLRVGSSDTAPALFVRSSNGNVGIGTANPTTKLDVTGNASISGSFELTGTMKGGDGSASQPSYAFASEATGMFLPAAKTLGFSYGGASRYYLNYDSGTSTGYWAPINANQGDLGLSGFEWRHIYSKGTYFATDNVSSGTTPRAQWMEFQSTSALGTGAYSMIQMDIDKDQTAWPNSNGLFVDVTGDYTIASHLNMDALSDHGLAQAIGLHGPNQLGVAFDSDDTNNTAIPIKIAQGGTNGNTAQNLLQFNAEENLIDGVYGGSFTGDFIEAYVRGISKFRVGYNGTASVSAGFEVGGYASISNSLYANGSGNVGIGTTSFANGNKVAITGSIPLGSSVLDYATIQVNSAPSSTAANSVGAGLWSTMTNTTSTAGGSGHLIGVFGNAVDTTSGKTTMYGVEGRLDGRSTATYTGASISYIGVTGQSHYQGVRSSAGTYHIGFDSVVDITSDGSTPSLTGNAIAFYAEPIIGGAVKYAFLGSDIIRTTGGIESPGAGGNSMRIGTSATAGGAFSVAVGDANSAGAAGAIALGYGNSVGASHTGSIVVGVAQSSTAANQMVVGSSNANTAYINDVYIGSGVTDTTPVGVTYNATGGSGSNIAGADITIAGGKGTGTGAGGSVILKTAARGTAGSSANSLTTRMTLTQNGLLSLGTTAAPTSRFTLVDSGTGSTSSGSFSIRSSNTTGTVASISATSLTTGSVMTMLVPTSASQAGVDYLVIKDTSGQLYASLGAGGAFTLRRNIFSHGATSNCTSANTPTQNCIDYAENFPTKDESIVAGEIVAVDSDNGSHVIRAASGSMPLGIVSTNPAALIVGSALLTGSDAAEHHQGQVPVALAGRVPVKISAEGGFVKAGDHLALSRLKPGYAMKATGPGMTVGIALESSDALSETIMVFVNLAYWAPETNAGGESSSMSDGWLSLLRKKFEDFFNIIFDNGIIKTVKGIFKSVELDQGATIFDRVTKEPYCVTVENGAVVPHKGKCDEMEPTPRPAAPVPSPEVLTESPTPSSDAMPVIPEVSTVPDSAPAASEASATPEEVYTAPEPVAPPVASEL
jgi:hypothetical protein